MKVVLTRIAQDDLAYWKKTDADTVKKIAALVEDIQQSPFKGLGKPEPCRHGLAGKWSRRISKEHRLVYSVDGKGQDKALTIYQCRYHYAG